MTAVPHPLPDAAEARALYRPTCTETVIACETLLRADLPREARAVVREILQQTAEKSHG